jgi:hypothetical protein
MLAVISLLAFAACTATTKPKATETPSFRQSFRVNFLASCTHGSLAAAKVSYCACAEATLEKAYSDDQLSAFSLGATPQQQKDAARRVVAACRPKT